MSSMSSALFGAAKARRNRRRKIQKHVRETVDSFDSLKELALELPWLEDLLIEILRNKFCLAKPVNEVIAYFTLLGSQAVSTG